MIIVCKSSSDELSRIIARMIADRIRIKPDLVLGLATGSTPLGIYKELIRLRMHKEENLDFSKVVTFNLDEYIGLPPTHEQSYHRFMYDNLFKHININPSNIHIPSGDFEVKDPDNIESDPQILAFCEWYENKIKSYGGIDFQILGIGSDGHIAFNEPGSSLASRTRVEVLMKRTIQDNARFFNGDVSKVPTRAVTMGVGTILEAKEIVLMATGTGKSDAVKAAIEDPSSLECWLTDRGKAYILIDEAAANKLSAEARAIFRPNKK